MPLSKQEYKVVFKHEVFETTTDDAGTPTTLIPGHVTIEKKAKKKNDVKARSMLLMALPNEHLTTFNQYKYAKTLFAAIETRFDTISVEDLYNNFKIVEQEVRGTASTNTNSQNMAFVSSPSPNSTNEVPTILGVSTANLSDAISYMANDEAPTNMAFMDLPDSELQCCPTSSHWKVSPPRIDLSHTGLLEFAEPSVQSYGVKCIEVVTYKSSVKISTPIKENNGAPLIKDWESNEEDEVESPPKKERKTIKPTVDKVELEIHKQNDKPTRRLVKYAEMYITQRPRGNQRNWNNLKSHQLVLNAVRANKDKAVKALACWVCRPIKLESALIVLKKHTYIDARGRSKSETYPISLTSRSLMEGMLHLGDELKVERLLEKEQPELMCDKTNNVFFNDIECFVLSPDFKLADESHVLLKVLRKNNMYSVC
nr:ribonuclease H-like domain-containing protein [Tanacetum cinerariifolium]